MRKLRLYLPFSQPEEKTLLTEENAHYLGNVLRARAGDEIETFDGVGNLNLWKITGQSRNSVELENLGKSSHVDRRSGINLIIGLNPLKGGSEEVAIRVASAMDVVGLVPVFFSRSDVPFEPEKITTRMERWRRISISEAAQSGSAWLPDIHDPVEFKDFEPGGNRVILFDERADCDAQPVNISPGENITALVGPEGGLEREEVEKAMERGYEIGSLGPWTLRSELAAAIIPAILNNNLAASP